MASDSSGNIVANGGNAFGPNAGRALEALVPGPDRDKRIAKMLRLSTRMVRYLRKGEHWTPELLTLASSILGKEFDQRVIGHQPAPLLSNEALERRLMDLHQRLLHVQRQVDQLTSGTE